MKMFVRLRNEEGRVVSVPEEMADSYQGYTREAEKPSEDLEAPAPFKDTTPVTPAAESAKERPVAAVVRGWAKDNGVPVPAKGRVPEDVYEKYAQAH